MNVPFSAISRNCQIFGRLLTENNQPIIAGAVKLFSADSTYLSGALTDSIGRFHISFIQDSVAYIQAECLGYKCEKRTFNITGDPIYIDDIHMSPSQNSLGEVTVVADRMTKTDKGITIYPRKNDLKFASSGYDVLYNLMIPGIDINKSNGSISRLGETVGIYINGRAASYREIQNIPVKLIERVEYIDIPFGIYINDTSAINIITKKDIHGAYYSLSAKQNLSYQNGEYNVMAQHSNDKMTMQVYGGYEYQDYNNDLGSTNEHYSFDRGHVSQHKIVGDNLNKMDQQYLQAYIMSSSKKRKLSANLSFIREHLPNNLIVEHINNTTHNSSDISSENLKPSLRLMGDFNLPARQRISATFTSTFANNSYQRKYNSDDFANITNVKENILISSMNFNYTKQMKDATFTFSLSDSYRNSDVTYSGSTEKKQDMYTNEAILQTGFMKKLNNQFLLNSRIGVSWLSYHLNGTNGVNQISPRINVMLRYSPSSTNALSFNFNSGNSFPLISTLNDVTQVVNEYMIKKGNPDLKMSNIYNTALMYNHFSKKFNLQTMMINNIFTHMTLPYYIKMEDNVLYTFDSNTKLTQYLVVVSGTYTPTNSLSLKSEIAMIHSAFNGRFEKRHNVLRSSFDANYILKNVAFNISLKLPEKTLSNNGIINRDFIHYNANIGWAFHNWYFELGTMNLFSKKLLSTQSYHSQVYSYDTESYNRAMQSNVYIKVNLKFNKGKKQKIQRIDLDKTIDSSIMKL